jgi:hypothetical protein
MNIVESSFEGRLALGAGNLLNARVRRNSASRADVSAGKLKPHVPGRHAHRLRASILMSAIGGEFSF